MSLRRVDDLNERKPREQDNVDSKVETVEPRVDERRHELTKAVKDAEKPWYFSHV